MKPSFSCDCPSPMKVLANANPPHITSLQKILFHPTIKQLNKPRTRNPMNTHIQTAQKPIENPSEKPPGLISQGNWILHLLQKKAPSKKKA
jgi:hypothetical protein